MSPRAGSLTIAQLVLRFEKSFNSSRELWQVSSLALPHDHHFPTVMLECFEVSLVARSIGEPLGFPEVYIRCGHYSAVSTVVHVKEAAVDIDNLSVSDEDQIRFAGKTLFVERISIAHPMNN